MMQTEQSRMTIEDRRELEKQIKFLEEQIEAKPDWSKIHELRKLRRTRHCDSTVP